MMDLLTKLQPRLLIPAGLGASIGLLWLGKLATPMQSKGNGSDPKLMVEFLVRHLKPVPPAP
jgi:hypothetical protein